MNIIYELTPSRFSLVAPLFNKIWADRALIDSVLEGTRPARVFVDYPDSPVAALIAAHNGEYYISGEPRPGRLRQFLQDLPEEANLFERDGIRLHTPQLEWKETLEKDSNYAFRFNTIRTFRYSRKTIAPIERWMDNVALPITVSRLGPDVLAKVHDGSMAIPEGMTPKELDVIYRDTFAFVAVTNNTLASIAYAKAVSSWYATCFTYTAEGYRHQKLGSLVSAAFIDSCIETRLTPLLACDAGNIAAATLAFQIGFEEGPKQYVCEDVLPPTDGYWRAEEHPPDVVPDSIIWMRVKDMIFNR